MDTSDTTDESRITIEHDARNIRVVRNTDNKVLISVSRSDDEMLERVADTLSAHRLPALAEKVRRIHHGREGMVTVA